MLLAIILLILALAAWQSLAVVLSTLLLAVLVTVAQVGLAAAGDSNKWLGGAHALDGMIILLLSLWLAIAAWRRRSHRKNLDNPA
jgi:membrane protein YdbS with pleckstrin-like domain